MMPLDVQSAAAPPPDDLPSPPVLRPVQPAPEAVVAIAERIRAARRPLILAGRGAVLAGARGPLERLADLAGALLATSAVANGFFSGSPWSLGISGGFTPPVAAELIAEGDLVLAFGASLNMWTTRRGHLVSPDAIVVQIDDEAQALGSHHRVDLPVVGEAGETARALLLEVEKRNDGWRTPELAERGEIGVYPQPEVMQDCDRRPVHRTDDGEFNLMNGHRISVGHGVVPDSDDSDAIRLLSLRSH